MSTTLVYPSSSPVEARPEPGYRLTRRGRVVVLGFALAVLVAIGVVFAGVSGASEEPPPVETVVVGPGDTLWGIAAEATADSGSSDVRDMIERIERLNDLDQSMVVVGQRLQVPRLH